MTEVERDELYVRYMLQFETTMHAFLEHNLIDPDSVPMIRKHFYDDLDEAKLQEQEKIRSFRGILQHYILMRNNASKVSLTDIAREYSDDSPGYVIQSWMRSRNTLAFLRQWEIEMNSEFDCEACDALIDSARSSSRNITPSLWVQETKAVGLRVKQGKGGSVFAEPEIALDFHMWLDPALRLEIAKRMIICGEGER